MKKIILEGPDGAGKTTLAKELELLGYTYFHFGVPTDAERKNLFQHFLKPLQETKGRAVFDRSYLSNPTYDEIVRAERSSITHEEYRKLDRYVSEHRILVVMCLPPFRTILNNWIKNLENEYVKDVRKLKRIYCAYEELLEDDSTSGSELPYLHFDYTKWDVESFAAALNKLEAHRALPS